MVSITPKASRAVLAKANRHAAKAYRSQTDSRSIYNNHRIKYTRQAITDIIHAGFLRIRRIEYKNLEFNISSSVFETNDQFLA